MQWVEMPLFVSIWMMRPKIWLLSESLLLHDLCFYGPKTTASPSFPLAHRTKAQEFTFQNSCTAIASWQKISPYIVLNNLHNILDSGIYYYFLNVLWMWCLLCLSKLIRSWEGRSHMKTKKHKLQPFCTHLVWHLLRT